MPLNERITNAEMLKAWADKIPLAYDYTAGVAGEKFLRGLQAGKILAAECDRCGRSYLPPKMYCVECFVPMKSLKEVGPEGKVEALTESYVGFDGKRVDAPRRLAFVTFKGTAGGIVHSVRGEGLRIGSRVRASFVPESKRSGSLLDIEAFVEA